MTNSEPIVDPFADQPATDFAALERLRRFGGGKLLREMIDLFLAAAPERIAAARLAMESHDTQGAELALHSLKSSSAQLGAMRMQRLSEHGERLAHNGTLVGVDRVVQDLDEEFARVQVWLITVRDGGTSE